MEANGSCPYHPRATPRKVIGKTRHIMTSEVLYKAIYALNATTCSTGSESPSYASNVGRQKICGTGVHQTPGRAAQRGMFESCRDLRWVVDKLALGELRLGSLNRCQCRPGVREDGFPSPNKGSRGGGCRAPLEVICVAGGIFPEIVER
ncbi:hypothetical protein BHE74_00023792 [Ensete ventricosum]|nr:hypothetical protein BHE74_00023792 [Ensete ventricosum]